MSDFVLQGEAFQFDEPFISGDDILYANSGCFDESIRSGKNVRLLIDHDSEQCLGDSSKRLLVHAGKTSLAFRYLIPESIYHSQFADMADDVESYIPVSISHRPTKTQTEYIKGVKVITVLESELTEVSLLSGSPAVKSSYARVSSWCRCSGLKEDYDAGMFQLTGRVINIHRAMKARENGGKFEYRNATSPPDRAADNFLKALRRLG